jgi:hypothetical protein
MDLNVATTLKIKRVGIVNAGREPLNAKNGRMGPTS